MDGAPVFQRELAQVQLARSGSSAQAAFRIDWHLVGLPIIQERDSSDPLAVFKRWLGDMLILKPVPSVFNGESDLRAIHSEIPGKDVHELGAWFSAMISAEPGIYTEISDYLAQVMPDFTRITNVPVGTNARNLAFHFGKEDRSIELTVDQLSDGEKCFVVFALAIAANAAMGPLLCFWDEPDNFLSPDEVGHSVLALRRAFRHRGQLIATSHNPETIRKFSDSNTLHLSRKSHLEPTIVMPVETMRAAGRFDGGLVDALIRGDIDP